MKIVSDQTIINIDFVEGFLTGEKVLQGLFSVKVGITAASLSGMGKDIWYSISEFEEFLNILKRMDKEGFGKTMLQGSVEAGEDYALYGDSFSIIFSLTTATQLTCHSTLQVGWLDPYINTSSTMFSHTFGIHRSIIPNLIAEFETFKEIIVKDLTRRAKEEKAED